MTGLDEAPRPGQFVELAAIPPPLAEKPTMTLRRAIAPLLSASLIALTLAAASLPETGEEPALSDLMRGMKVQLKLLSEGLKGPLVKEPQALAALTELQVLTIAAKRGDPPHLDELAPKRQRATRNAYKADLARLLQELSAMEIDVLEGHPEQAVARLRADLLPLRDAAHEKFE